MSNTLSWLDRITTGPRRFSSPSASTSMLQHVSIQATQFRATNITALPRRAI
jgi:hypothetical protein